jgi:hypothetical protein
MKPFKIKASYSFWKHPIRYVKEMKYRRILQLFMEYEWEHGMKEEVEKETKDLLLYGYHNPNENPKTKK